MGDSRGVDDPRGRSDAQAAGEWRDGAAARGSGGPRDGAAARSRAAAIGLAGALAVLGGKFAAFLLTGSVSLLSDAAESIINVLGAVSVIVALRLARKPPDYEHPYGHQKAELLSSAFEAMLIVAAGAMLLVVGFQRLLDPRPLDNVSLGVIVAGAAGAVNLILALWLGRQGRLLGSEALRANSRHLLTDVWSSVGVILAVILVGATGWLVLDPVIALVVAGNVIREGILLLRRSMSQLLDERLPEEVEAQILGRLDADPDVRGYHRLRSRRSGAASFVEVDVFVNPSMTVAAAHEVAMRLEENLRREVPGIETTIHIEPVESGVREGATSPREEYD